MAERELLARPERHASFRQAARDDAVERFDEEMVVSRYENYYRQVLEG